MIQSNFFESLPSDARRVCGMRMLGLAMMFVVFATTGCGDGRVPTYPVKGKVAYPDGSPVTEAVITLQPVDPPEGVQPLPARGVVQPDGTFVLTTFKEADGAIAGHHRATVTEPYSSLPAAERPPSRGIHPKYREFETSGLEFDVKEEPNELTVTVEPAKK